VIVILDLASHTGQVGWAPPEMHEQAEDRMTDQAGPIDNLGQALVFTDPDQQLAEMETVRGSCPTLQF
jgi:hypothetical protein